MLLALPFTTSGESAAAAVQTLRRAQADAVTRIDAPLSAARSVCSERSWCYLCHARGPHSRKTRGVFATAHL
jgi:hypothetical protein